MTPSISSLEADLKQSQLLVYRLLHLNQLKSGFLARSAHELRSPLSGLIGLQEMILAELCDSPEEEREFVAHGKAYALKLLELLNQLIDLSKLEVGDVAVALESFAGAELCQQVYDIMSLPVAHRGIRFHRGAIQPEIWIYGEPFVLQQVLILLIETAVMMIEDGTIVLSAQALPEKQQALIHVDISYAPQQLQEEIHLLEKALLQPQLPLLKQKPDLETVTFSPGMKLILAQLLLEQMRGSLTLETPLPSHPHADAVNPDPRDNDFIRLQCSLPLAEDETART